MSIVYLNGAFMPQSEASISVLDRGFLFADSIYEVIPVFANRPFRYQQHMQRLQRSLREIRLTIDWTPEQWKSLCRELVERNDLANGSLYIQITRGVRPQRQHDLPNSAETTPTIYAHIAPLPQVESKAEKQAEETHKPLKVITAQDIRWKRCDIKSTNLLANCLMKQRALEIGADDTILLQDRLVIEATSSNVFLVKDGTLVTPTADEQLLSGITREFVMALAIKKHLNLEVRDVNVTELYEADEVWLTSSTQEISPVVKVDDAIIGTHTEYAGQVGPIWHEMNQYYQQLKQRLYDGEFGDEVIL